MLTPQARILEVGPYPPPDGGWSTRVKSLKEKILDMGHTCNVLNVGEKRRVPSDEYITVRNGFDYITKVVRYTASGFTCHLHTNGDVWPTGWLLVLIAEFVGLLFGRRAILTFHAGVHQVYFPRERSGWFRPLLRVMFKLPKLVICNDEAVKQKIMEYGLSGSRIVPISPLTGVANVHARPLPERLEEFLGRHDPLVVTYAHLRKEYYIETLVEGTKHLCKKWPNIGLVVVGALNEPNAAVREAALAALSDAGIDENVFWSESLGRPQFVSLLGRGNLYLRTPTTDGQASSVLEALLLGVPVVASENGTRPASVLTYPSDDPIMLSQTVDVVLSEEHQYRARIASPAVRDTLSEEAKLLIDQSLPNGCGGVWGADRDGSRSANPGSTFTSDQNP